MIGNNGVFLWLETPALIVEIFMTITTRNLQEHRKVDDDDRAGDEHWLGWNVG